MCHGSNLTWDSWKIIYTSNYLGLLDTQTIDIRYMGLADKTNSVQSLGLLAFASIFFSQLQYLQLFCMAQRYSNSCSCLSWRYALKSKPACLSLKSGVADLAPCTKSVSKTLLMMPACMYAFVWLVTERYVVSIALDFLTLFMTWSKNCNSEEHQQCSTLIKA